MSHGPFGAMAGDVVPPLTLAMYHHHKNTGWADFNMIGY